MPQNKHRIKLESLITSLKDLGTLFDLSGKLQEIKQLEEETSLPSFWENGTTAQEKINRLKSLKTTIVPFTELESDIKDLLELLEIGEDEGGGQDEAVFKEIAGEISGIEERLRSFSYVALFQGKHDARNSFLSIHSGAGGTDACDWTEILLRMYCRWLERNGFKYNLIDSLKGDEAGLRRVALYVEGRYAFGYLKSEIGVHRLVRLSPFNANHKRHTSFASVDVIPEIEVEKVKINEGDLKIDTYSAGGPGGQHVNKTASAVRITHLPSGIVVQCQNERSQHQNKQTAMKMLVAKLNSMKEKEKETDFHKMYGEKGDIAWSYQIRSYTLHPYTMVKDHRVNVEVGDVQAVLDGEKLSVFMEAYLRSRNPYP
ncbi:MAG: peptide chain release factor 2 [Planctomycetota bacterium]|nr:peptide chain release factor 2 [Planctomycetota bacterium]